jgi:DNA-directed RNA polymerase specialized sigma24 family protein
MWRPTVVFDALPEVAVGDPASEDRIVLLAALAEVPPRPRRCWLRYWEDLSVEATARVLGCSSGTVKSQASRGQSALRSALGDALPEPPGRPAGPSIPGGDVR